MIQLVPKIEVDAPREAKSEVQGIGPGNGPPGAQEESCKQPRTTLPGEEAPGGHRWLAPRPVPAGGQKPWPALLCGRALTSGEVCPLPAHLRSLLAVAEAEPHAEARKTSPAPPPDRPRP
uniref:Uncharacterized protein n=1 Tax=Rangifer tarandus platyrhynchus TaxID=3082113 RepID=A0ACB0FL41_RANTA|nr:unnamed protein product [Rangifer tarandus platyrhynchus]